MINARKMLMSSITILSFITASTISASAAINTTAITEGMNAIWTIIGNVTDNFGVIITLVIFMFVIALIGVVLNFLRHLLTTKLMTVGKD